MTFALLLLVAAATADPEGTVALDLEAGDTRVVTAEPGASVLCDDLRVATGEFAADGSAFVIRALRPGTTLCGVWLSGQKPGGLYRVHVRAGSPADAGAPKPAARDAGPPDGGR